MFFRAEPGRLPGPGLEFNAPGGGDPGDLYVDGRMVGPVVQQLFGLGERQKADLRVGPSGRRGDQGVEFAPVYFLALLPFFASPRRFGPLFSSRTGKASWRAISSPALMSLRIWSRV